MSTNTQNSETSGETASAGRTTRRNTLSINVADTTTDKRQGDVPSVHSKPEVVKKEQDTSSTSDLLTFIKSQQETTAVINRTTSTPDCVPCGCPETVFYHIHQQVGTKSRYTEFRQGCIVWDDKELIRTIGENVCGFLNSEGGTVFIGVEASGLVVGVRIHEWEMKGIRDNIEHAIGCIKPPIDPGEYSINFARVMEDFGGFSKNLKVVEVCVKPRKPPASCYKFHKVVCIRKDNSLQKIPSLQETTT